MIDEHLSIFASAVLMILTLLVIYNAPRFMASRAYDPTLPIAIGTYLDYISSVPGNFSIIYPTSLGNLSELRISLPPSVISVKPSEDIIEVPEYENPVGITIGRCEKAKSSVNTLHVIFGISLVAIGTVLAVFTGGTSLALVAAVGSTFLGDTILAYEFGKATYEELKYMFSDKCYNSDLTFKPISTWIYNPNINILYQTGNGFVVEDKYRVLRPGETTPNCNFVSAIEINKVEYDGVLRDKVIMDTFYRKAIAKISIGIPSKYCKKI